MLPNTCSDLSVCFLTGLSLRRWVNFTYMAGILIWQPAVYLQMVEALNTNIDARIMDWEESGRQGPKPRCLARHAISPLHQCYPRVGILMWRLHAAGTSGGA